MSKVEAILNFLQSSDAFVVKGCLDSKAKPCCSDKMLFRVPRGNRGCSYWQEGLSIRTMWALEATLADPFPGPDETILSTSRM